MQHMSTNSFERLAKHLDDLPNGFPPAPDGAELRLLEKLFAPEEADLAAELRLTLETPAQIAARLAEGGAAVDARELQTRLKGMARKGLINAGRTEGGLGYGALPFVVGIYEAQAGRVDAELARLFEAYYRQAFSQMLAVQPAFHRVIPVNESVKVDMAIRPYESATDLIKGAQSWGVLDCICRVQKSLIGEGCHHPVDVCMALGYKPGVFDHSPVIRSLTMDEALATLQRAADAGLVHSVSNVCEEVTYICNCCTCACGILRGVVESGLPNVVARSAFLNRADEDLCIGCEACLDACQFGALALVEGLVQVKEIRCVGCGVCIPVCPEGALGLVRRSPEDTLSIPRNEEDWRLQRSNARGIDLGKVL